MKPIKFPQDELEHNHSVEWWYWNGHLKDKQGHRYSYMNCLFKADLKKVKFPFLIGAPIKTLFFSHSLVTDIARKIFFPRIDYLSFVSSDSFSKKKLFINYINPISVHGYVNNIMEKTEKGDYLIKNEDLELYLKPVKKPILEGGNGFLNLGNKSTYYYSLPNLKTKGKLKLNNKIIDVSGKSWMDHQWADTEYEKDQWTWFSIQLDNNTEIVCIEFGKKNQYKLAHISYPNNKQFHTSKFNIIPLEKVWKSKQTKAEYPLQWKIEIPDKKVSLELKALVRHQEMVFGTINYWEGPLDVQGTIAEKKVSGVSFAELVGYPSELGNIKFIKSSVRQVIQSGYKMLTKKG